MITGCKHNNIPPCPECDAEKSAPSQPTPDCGPRAVPFPIYVAPQPTPEARVELEALLRETVDAWDGKGSPVLFTDWIARARAVLAHRSAPTPGYREGWEAGREAAAAKADAIGREFELSMMACAAKQDFRGEQLDHVGLNACHEVARKARALLLPESAGGRFTYDHCPSCHGRFRAPAPVETREPLTKKKEICTGHFVHDPYIFCPVHDR